MVLVRFNPDSGVRAIVNRPIQFGEPQVIALTDIGLHPVLGLSSGQSETSSDWASRVKLGSPLELWQRNNEDGSLNLFVHGEDDEFWRATCDPATGLVYVGTKATILQVELGSERSIVTLLAGIPGEEESVDGPGADARVDRPFCMVADGHGSLLIKDCGANRVRRVRLPAPGSPPGSMSPGVVTLPIEYAANLWAVALDYSDPQRLYVATKTALYRHDTLPYNASDSRTGEDQEMAPADEAAAATGHTLLAGREGENTRTDGVVAGPIGDPSPGANQAEPAAWWALPHRRLGGDGGGGSGAGRSAGGSGGHGAAAESTARFGHITFMLIDATGRLILVEREPHDVEPVLRIVWPSGLVTTFEADFEVTGSEFVMAILPHGWLALHAWDGSRVQLLRLDPSLRPSLPPSRTDPLGAAVGELGAAASGGASTAAAAAATEASMPGQPGLSGLASDLSSLLLEPVSVGAAGGSAGGCDGDDGAAVASDVAVVVGDRRFRCHRAILAARCEYFRCLFKRCFAESGDSQISLPDADPEAFALLLRFLYSSSLDIPPPLLRPAAELADRLLLPAASRHAQAQLLAATGPSTVVEDLLWAEEHHFLDLLAGLKEYYLAHAHAVLEEAPDSLELLMLRSPKLHLELYAAGIKRARRRTVQ